MVNRGTLRCGICQGVIGDDPSEVFEGESCHSRCVEYEQQGS